MASVRYIVNDITMTPALANAQKVLTVRPNPAFNRTRREAASFLAERQWRRAGYRER